MVVIALEEIQKKNFMPIEYFVSQQYFIDMKLSYDFIVLWISHFKEYCSDLWVPLHFMGSDTCETSYSKNRRNGGPREGVRLSWTI